MGRAFTEASIWLDDQMQRDPFFAESGEGAFLLNLVRGEGARLQRIIDQRRASKTPLCDHTQGGTT
jgi:hypothetical protein